MKVQWSERALQDLESLLDYIATDNPSAARRHAVQILQRTDQLKAFPLSGPVSREVGEPFRELRSKPVRIIYLVDGGLVTIVAVYREEQNLRGERRASL